MHEFAKLISERTLHLSGDIDDARAVAIVALLMLLESQSPEDKIFLYLNTTGGSVTAALAIYDVIQTIQSSVATVCLGQAGGISVLLLSSGAAGQRYAMRDAIIRPGQFSFADDMVDEVMKFEREQITSQLCELLAISTGQNAEQIARDIERRICFSAEGAREYGIVDCVITSLDQVAR